LIFGGTLHEAFDEAVMQAVMDKEAVRRHADLAGICKLRRHRHVEGGFEIGIVVDDQRRVAAEFHGDLLHRGRRVADHLLTDARGACQ
jgi:hypothetical protein